jgi:hypothetical protein
MTDVLTLFNQLTHRELADYSIGERVGFIMTNHYEKFKYFYHLMEDVKINKVDKIKCSDSEDTRSLVVRVDFDDKKHMNRFQKEFSNIAAAFRGYPAKYFSVDISIDKKSLYITIENKNISSEEDIYEDRFNTD